MRRTIFFCAIGVLLLVSIVSAGVITIEQEEGTAYLVLDPGAQVAISAFRVQLSYPESVTITDIVFSPPYSGAYNIQNDNGSTLISGFTGGKASTIQLVKIDFTGNGHIDVFVKKIIDYDLNVIISDEEDNVSVQPVPSVPEYALSPGYISPEGTASGTSNPDSGTPQISQNTQPISTSSGEREPSYSPGHLDQVSTPQLPGDNGSTGYDTVERVQQSSSPAMDFEEGLSTNTIPLSMFSLLAAIIISIIINYHGRR